VIQTFVVQVDSDNEMLTEHDIYLMLRIGSIKSPDSKMEIKHENCSVTEAKQP
jgi:hypothetical protein